MTGSKPPVEKTEYQVGDRVTTVVLGDSGTDKFAGTIVEDFRSSIDSADMGRNWAAQRRWAVALDDGRLVFRDSSEITAVG